VPIQKDGRFGGVFCADLAPMGNLKDQYQLPENESAYYMIYSSNDVKDSESFIKMTQELVFPKKTTVANMINEQQN
jgi:hypothetical protein